MIHPNPDSKAHRKTDIHIETSRPLICAPGQLKPESQSPKFDFESSLYACANSECPTWLVVHKTIGIEDVNNSCIGEGTDE